MIEIVSFDPSHLTEIDLIQAQEHVKILFNNHDYVGLLNNNMSYTLFHDGQIIACGGIFMLMPHVGRAWALLSKCSGRHMLAITKIVRIFLRSSELPRIDTFVLTDYNKGKRWLDILGFINETPLGMPGYGMNGESYDQYRYVGSK